MPPKKQELEGSNHVSISGKVTQSGRLKYTPSGLAVLEICVAVPQSYLEKKSVGYFTVLLTGELAENRAHEFRVGSVTSITGNLWTRKFKNRQGNEVTEFHVVAKEIGHKVTDQSNGEENEKNR